jgi:hypothetical protein
MFSRRTFLKGLAVAGLPVMAPPLGSTQAFSVDPTPVYADPNLESAIVGHLQPETLFRGRIQQEWYVMEYGYVPIERVQLFTAHSPSPPRLHFPHLVSAQVVTLSTVVRLYADSHAPIVDKLPYAAQVTVTAALQDCGGEVWYESTQGWILSSVVMLLD